jgi:hypothetical protein
MEPGKELDVLIAEKVMGWKKLTFDAPIRGLLWIWDHKEGALETEVQRVPSYSTDITAAWEVVSKLAPIVGDFQEADGFFILKYADSADHTTGKNCPAEWTEDMTAYDTNEDSEDTHKWSAHFHPGHPGADTESAKMFPDYKKSCARGRTAAHAICLAALKIFET